MAIFPAFKRPAVVENEANIQGGRAGKRKGWKWERGIQREERSSTQACEFQDLAVTELCSILPLSAIGVYESIHDCSLS